MKTKYNTGGWLDEFSKGGQISQQSDPMDWLNEGIQPAQRIIPKKPYHSREKTKVSKSVYLPHPSVMKTGGWLDNE